MFGLTQIQTIVIGTALGVVLIGGAITYIYNKGENAGSSSVTTAVQKKTVQTLDNARQSKEKANEEVRRTPLDVLIDGQLR